MHHVMIRDNVMIGVDNPTVGDGGGTGFLIGAIADLSIEHNTAFLPATSSSMLLYVASPTQSLARHTMRNNLFGGGRYPLTISPGPLWSDVTDISSQFTSNALGFTDAE